MEDLETWAALEFHGVAYVVTVQVRHQTLLLQVELASPPADANVSSGCWTGHFPAADVEELTRKTGNSKRFAVFVRMLLSALAQRSAAVFVDLLTAADLDLYRKRKLGTASLPTRADAIDSTTDSGTGKRYLILTYAVEFDRVHYPLPLELVQSPSPEMLQRTIRRLRQALAAATTGNTSSGLQKNSTQLQEENAALREENRCLKSTLKQYCDDEAVGRDPSGSRSSAALERELQASMEENKELISLYQQFREDSAAENARLRAQIKQLQLASQESDRVGQNQTLEQEQERRETRRKIQDSNAAVQETLAQMLQMKAQVEETQLKNRELLRQLAVARARATQQNPSSRRQPSAFDSSTTTASRPSPGASTRRTRSPVPARARQQPKDSATTFPAPFRSSASQYGASDDEDGSRSARRSRTSPRPRPAFRRFDPTAYQQEKQRKLQEARARANSRSRAPRSNGGYTSDSSAGGYSSADSRTSKASARSTGSRGRSRNSRMTAQQQRELDARLASPKKSMTPPAAAARQPRSGPPRPRSRSRGRSPSPSPSLNNSSGHAKSLTKPASPLQSRPEAGKPPQTELKTRRKLPQELLDTSADSFSDIDDRLTALQQFLREAKQGGGALDVGVGSSTAA